MYGNEKHLGNAFQKLLPKHGLSRGDIFITTKFVPSVEYRTEVDYRKLVETSLKNLQTDYLDMMLLHWPGVYGAPKDEVVKIRHNAWNCLSKFKDEGLIRSIGVSNFLIRHLEAMKDECDVVPALNQVEWHPMCHDVDLLKYCNDHKILLQSYSTLGTSSDRSLRNNHEIEKIAQKYGKSTSQVLLRWANRQGVAIIPKASSKAHQIENMDLNFEISEGDLDKLNSMPQMRLDWDPNDVL
jgi:diketogulonate reductase-like aldo/keto reductase